ncbi:FBXW5 [Mytilus edulis]|uniref:Mediator of RNA polymerase II transcription subunit 29 n=1 Tax=Mytilus edulis TaxID=6550 RepID=A0A8S3TWW8_MYTED|nr:FBXW5 [Mytilus edulis]
MEDRNEEKEDDEFKDIKEKDLCQDSVWNDGSIWQHMPDDFIIHIFSFLDCNSLLEASKTCSKWRRVAIDESLWKDLVSCKVGLPRASLPDCESWYEEFRRLCMNVPVVESEVLKEHEDEVYHVMFSPSGKYFSSTGKDGNVIEKHSKSYLAKFNKSFEDYFSLCKKLENVLLETHDATFYVTQSKLMKELNILEIIPPIERVEDLKEFSYEDFIDNVVNDIQVQHDQEVLVTVADDLNIRVWRSRQAVYDTRIASVIDLPNKPYNQNLIPPSIDSDSDFPDEVVIDDLDDGKTTCCYGLKNRKLKAKITKKR